MKLFTTLFISLLLFSPHAYSWTFEGNYENGSLGTQPTQDDGLRGRQLTVFSNDYARSGSQSIKAGINVGTTGDKQFGGRLELPSSLKEGDELWLRVFYYYPAGFDFAATGGGLKTSRVHIVKSNGDHEGYHTLTIKNKRLNAVNEINSALFVENNPGGRDNLGDSIPTGQWMAVEHYIKFHSVPGQAAYRIWQNGQLVFEDTKTNTLRESGSHTNQFLIYTYWNGDAPQTQAAYLDDLLMTNNTPSNVDSYGNNYIGIGDYVAKANPNPPIWK
jgi:hypothetical protein